MVKINIDKSGNVTIDTEGTGETTAPAKTLKFAGTPEKTSQTKAQPKAKQTTEPKQAQPFKIGKLHMIAFLAVIVALYYLSAFMFHQTFVAVGVMVAGVGVMFALRFFSKRQTETANLNTKQTKPRPKAKAKVKVHKRVG